MTALFELLVKNTISKVTFRIVSCPGLSWTNAAILVYLTELSVHKCLFSFCLNFHILHDIIKTTLCFVSLYINIDINMQQIFVYRDVTTNYGPLFEDVIFNLDITRIHIKEFERLHQLTLLLDKNFGIQNFIQLPIQFATIRLQLIGFILNVHLYFF